MHFVARFYTVCSVVAALVVLSPVAAYGAGSHKEKGDAFKKACGEDAQKFCPDAKGKHGEMAKCLQGHMDELSPSCQKAVSAAHEKLSEFKKACGNDVKKLCPGMKPGGGKIMACLKTNEAQLSPSCQAAMSQSHAMQHGMQPGMQPAAK